MSTALRSTGVPTADAGEVIPGPGMGVEVMSHFTGRWVSGFTVEESGDAGFRLRRTSDSSVLPVWFSPDEVRITRD